MARSRPQIVVGVDGTSASSAAVSWAAAEARRNGAELRLVIAGDPARADYAKETVREVAARCRRESPGLEVVEEVVVDHPVPALLQRSAQAQVVVVGSRGRSRFVNALLGSVSTPVVAASACPVIVVRPEGFRRAEAESSPAHRNEARGWHSVTGNGAGHLEAHSRTVNDIGCDGRTRIGTNSSPSKCSR